jgi:membrane protein
VNRLVQKGNAKLGFGFLAGLAFALWSANSGMKAMFDALNVVNEEKEKRGRPKRKERLPNLLRKPSRM